MVKGFVGAEWRKKKIYERRMWEEEEVFLGELKIGSVEVEKNEEKNGILSDLSGGSCKIRVGIQKKIWVLGR